jgi:hypothetical protein
MLFRYICKTSTGSIFSEILPLKDCYTRAQPPDDADTWHVKIYSALLKEIDVRFESKTPAVPLLVSYNEPRENEIGVTNYIQILPDGLKTPFPVDV